MVPPLGSTSTNTNTNTNLQQQLASRPMNPSSHQYNNNYSSNNNHRSNSVTKDLPTSRVVNFQLDQSSQQQQQQQQHQQQQPRRAVSTTRAMTTTTTATNGSLHPYTTNTNTTTTTKRDRNSWSGNATAAANTNLSPLKQRQSNISNNPLTDPTERHRSTRPPTSHTATSASGATGATASYPSLVQFSTKSSSDVSPFGSENGNDDDVDSPDRIAQAIWNLREARMNGGGTTSSRGNNHNNPPSSSRSKQQKQQQQQSQRLGASSPPPSQRNQHSIRSASAPRPNIDISTSTKSTTNVTPAATSTNGSGKREYQHQLHNRSSSVQQLRSSNNNNSSNTYLSPKQQSSPEEERAAANIQRAEAKIDGLLQELEDLRFLEEIDLQDTIPSPILRSKSVPRIRNHETPAPQIESTSFPLKTPRGDTIPAVIRAISPPAVTTQRSNSNSSNNNYNNKIAKTTTGITSNVRPLPPPPKVIPNTNKVPEPSMVQILSPRVISKMERMTLELETQTLCRKVDVLNKEKSTLERAVEMYELTLQDQERESGMVKQLESDLRMVRQQLHQTKQDLLGVREQINAEYEHRLEDSVNKLQRTQAAADKYQQDRQVLQQELDNLRQEFKECKLRYKEEDARNHTQQKEREEALQVQIQEVADLADELKNQYEGEKEVVRQLSIKLKQEVMTHDDEMVQLQKEMEDRQSDMNEQLRTVQQEWRNKVSGKDREIQQLQDQLQKKEMEMIEIKRTKDDAYEVQIVSLQEELSLQNEKFNKLEQSRVTALSKIDEQSEELQQVKAQCTEQSELLKDMTERLDAVHIEYRDKFADVKDAYESKEKRRLQEMVQSHKAEVDVYENRIQSLQEQLSHQNDRHTKEIETKNSEHQAIIESHTREIRELKQDQKHTISMSEEKFKQLKSEYDQVAKERSALRQELDSMPTKEDAVKERHERERQDVIRDNEISRLTEKVERLTRDISTKSDRIQELSNKLIETERQYEQKLNRLKSLHTDALFQREQELSEQVKQMRAVEVTLRCDLDRKQSEVVETRTMMEARVSELQNAMEDSKREIETIRRRHEESQLVLRGEISVLEGKLRGAESILQQKCDLVEDLKERLEMSTSKEITSVESHKKEAERLGKEIQCLKDQLNNERDDMKETIERLQSTLKEKSNYATKVEGMLYVASSKCETMDQRVKEAEDACREAKAELIAERTRHATAEEQTRVDLAVLQGKFRASEASLKEKRETIEELEDQLRSIADESSTTNKELQKEVDQLRVEVKKLNGQLDKDRAELFTKGELLKQQQKKLQHNTDEMLALQQAIASKVQMEENRNREVSNLQATLDQALTDLNAAKVDKKNSVSALQEQLDETKTKLRNVEGELRANLDLVRDQEDKLRIMSIESSASAKEYQGKLEQQKQSSEENLVQLKLAMEHKTKQIEELQSQVNELMQKSEIFDQLKEELLESRKAESSLRDELNDMEEKLSTTSKSLEVEFTKRGEHESQLTRKISELECSLRDRTTELEKKQSIIDDLQANARKVSEEMSSAIVHLKTEINALQYDIKMSNDLLNKERAAMDAKVEEYEQLKVMNWNLRQKASRTETLENTISELREALDDARANSATESNINNRSTLNDLQDKVNSERRAKEEIIAKLVETETELEIKQQQLSRLPTLQAQLKQLVDEREELQAQFSQLEDELDRKNAQIGLTAESRAERVSILEAELNESKKSYEEVQSQLRKVELELSNHRESSTRALPNINSGSTAPLLELQAKVDLLTKTKSNLEAKVQELEEDKEDRERQVRESSERYSNRILELQIQVEELSRKKTTLKTRLSRLESDLEYKDEQMSVASSQLSVDYSNLQSILSDRIAENDTLRTKLQAMESQVVEIESAREMKSKLDVESKEKRSLLTRIGDIEAELQRKEKQIRDIVDRYTRDIAELEYRLEDEMRSKAMLEKEIEKSRKAETTSCDSESGKGKDESALRVLQRDNTNLQIEIKKLKEDLKDALGSASEEKLAKLTKENSELQEKVNVISITAEKTKKRLEEQLDAAIQSNEVFLDRTVLEDKLKTMEKSKIELEERLKKVSSERNEVITALEEVISEVQSREDEIESLATVLRKRDDELEHAKLIATKAIASAQEMKQRLKRRSDGDRSQKVDDLNNSIDLLTKKNESLERKTSTMERELKQKELECGELRNKLQRISAKGQSKIAMKIGDKIEDDGFHSIDPDFQATFDTCSPTTKASSAFATTDSLSMGSAEQPVTDSGWLHNFDSNSNEEDSDEASAVSFSGIHTAASEAQSRRSIERDALRKYVRKRYLKSKA